MAAFFQPTDISGCFIWYNAAAINTINNGPVNYWIDSSGSGNHMTVFISGASTIPTYITNSINNLPTVSFNGNSVLRSVNDPSLNLNPSGLSLFTLFNHTTDNDQTVMCNARVGASLPIGSVRYCFDICINPNNQPSGCYFLTDDGNTTYTALGTGITKNSWSLRSDTFDKNNSLVISNFNIPMASSKLALTNSTANRILVGGNPQSSFFTGSIAEIIGYCTQLSNNDTIRVLDYLKSKYNLSGSASTPLFVVGAQSPTGSMYNPKSLYLYNNPSASSGVSLYTYNSVSVPSSVQLYTGSSQTLSSGKPLYIGSATQSSSGWNLYIGSAQSVTSSPSLYIGSSTVYNSGVYLYEGSSQSISLVSPLYISNIQAASVNNPLFISASTPYNSGVSLYIGASQQSISGMSLMTGPMNTTGQATFIGSGTSTNGNWIGVYGNQGYNILPYGTNYPSYFTSSLSGTASTFTFASNTLDQRALQDPSNPTGVRQAATWFNVNTFGLNVNISDGSTKTISLYFLDWTSAGRNEKISVVDSNSILLDSKQISNFGSGVYLSWNMSGQSTFIFEKKGGPNNVLGGIFVDNSTPLFGSGLSLSLFNIPSYGDSINLYTSASNNVSNGNSLYTSASQTAISGMKLYTSAVATTNNSFPLYTSSASSSTKSNTLYIPGGTESKHTTLFVNTTPLATISQPLYIGSSSPISSSNKLYIGNSVFASSSKTLYIANNVFTRNQHMNMFVKQNPPSTGTRAFTLYLPTPTTVGSKGMYGDFSLYMYSYGVGATMPMYLKNTSSPPTGSVSMPMYIKVNEIVNPIYGNVSAFVMNNVVATGKMGKLFIRGDGVTDGSFVANASMNMFVGQKPGNSQAVSLYIATKASSVLSTSLFAMGVFTYNSGKTLMISGRGSSGTVPLYLGAGGSFNSGLSLYTYTRPSINGNINLYTYGF